MCMERKYCIILNLNLAIVQDSVTAAAQYNTNNNTTFNGEIATLKTNFSYMLTGGITSSYNASQEIFLMQRMYM